MRAAAKQYLLFGYVALIDVGQGHPFDRQIYIQINSPVVARSGVLNPSVRSNCKSQADEGSNKRVPPQAEVSKRAYEFYVTQGEIRGYDVDDWLQAEYELCDCRPAIIPE